MSEVPYAEAAEMVPVGIYLLKVNNSNAEGVKYVQS